MSIDFSKLEALANRTHDKPPDLPQETFCNDAPIQMGVNSKTPTEGQEMRQVVYYDLQRQADQRKAAISTAADVYKKWQENDKRTKQLQTEILKGVRAGVGVYSLFLKAVEALSLTINNTVFYNQIAADVPAIYGIGLNEPEPLQMELEATQSRLEHLETALERETDSDSRSRIESAITQHKTRIDTLLQTIEKQQEE